MLVSLPSLVTAKAQPCSNSFDCPGVERCHSGMCACPENGITFTGVLCVSGPDKTPPNATDIWSSYHHCESSVYDYSPGLSIAFQLYGLLLHGSSLCASLLALWRLIRSGRARYNLQTYAVVLVACHGMLYTVHYALDPTSLRRQRLEMFMLSYMPAPLVVSLYNVTLLFLSDLTSMQLKDAQNASARSTVFISGILFLLFLVLFFAIQANQLSFYYVFWIIFLILSLLFTSRIGLRLQQRLRYAPSSQHARSKPNGKASQGSGKDSKKDSRRDSPGVNGATNTNGNGTTNGPTNTYYGGMNVSQLAVPADYQQRDSVQDIVVSTNGAPQGATNGGGTIAMPVPAMPNTLGSVAMVNGAPVVIHHPSRNAMKLRRRIMRFVWGSLCFSVAWLFVLLISVMVTQVTIDDMLLPLFIFRFFEECWCILLLLTFWPPSIARVAIARTHNNTRDGSNGGGTVNNQQANGATLGSGPNNLGSQTRAGQRGVAGGGSPQRDGASRGSPLPANRATMIVHNAPGSPKVALHTLGGGSAPQASPSNGINAGIFVVTEEQSPSHTDSFDNKSPSAAGYNNNGSRTPGGGRPSSRVPAAGVPSSNQLSPVHALPTYGSSPAPGSAPQSMIAAATSISPPVSGLSDPLTIPTASSPPPAVAGDNSLAPPRRVWAV